MAAELEQMLNNPRYKNHASRMGTLLEFVERFRTIKGFPEEVDGLEFPGRPNFLPLESLGRRIREWGFEKEGLVLVRTSRRWEYEDSFVPDNQRPIIQDGTHFRYNPSDGAVWVDERESTLTHSERALMNYMVHNPDRPVPYVEVEREGFLSNSHNIHVLVSRMNPKIERDPNKPERMLILRDVGLLYISEIGNTSKIAKNLARCVAEGILTITPIVHNDETREIVVNGYRYTLRPALNYVMHFFDHYANRPISTAEYLKFCLAKGYSRKSVFQTIFLLREFIDPVSPEHLLNYNGGFIYLKPEV